MKYNDMKNDIIKMQYEFVYGNLIGFIFAFLCVILRDYTSDYLRFVLWTSSFLMFICATYMQTLNPFYRGLFYGFNLMVVATNWISQGIELWEAYFFLIGCVIATFILIKLLYKTKHCIIILEIILVDSIGLINTYLSCNNTEYSIIGIQIKSIFQYISNFNFWVIVMHISTIYNINPPLWLIKYWKGE